MDRPYRDPLLPHPSIRSLVRRNDCSIVGNVIDSIGFACGLLDSDIVDVRPEHVVDVAAAAVVAVDAAVAGVKVFAHEFDGGDDDYLDHYCATLTCHQWAHRLPFLHHPVSVEKR